MRQMEDADAMTKIILTILVVVSALTFLYIGSTHRDRCIKAQNVGCTILPWSGHPTSAQASPARGWWNSP